MLDVGAIAERQLFNRLGSKGGQLGADAGLLLHPLDIMAAETAPLTHQCLAALDVVGIGKLFLNAGNRIRSAAQAH